MASFMRSGVGEVVSKRVADDVLTGLQGVFGADAAVVSGVGSRSELERRFFDLVVAAKRLGDEALGLEAWASRADARFAGVYRKAVNREAALEEGLFPLTRLASKVVAEMFGVLRDARQDMRVVVSLLGAMRKELDRKESERALWLLAQRVDAALATVALRLRLAGVLKSQAADEAISSAERMMSMRWAG